MPKKNFQKSARNLSPLSLLVLAACGGEESFTSGPVLGPGSANNSANGFVNKGPLSNALVYADYDDPTLGNSDSVRTGADGSYTLTTLNNNYTIVAVTDGNTIDTSSGTVLSGVTLKAPSGATVVTPTSTLMEEGGLTAAQVIEVLGLPEGVDPLTFNAFAADVNAADALAVEKASQQIMSVVNAFAAAAEGAGASQSDAFEAALRSVVEVVKTKAANLTDESASDADKALDLSNAADLALIQTEITTAVATVTGVDAAAFGRVANNTATAVQNVNTKIEAVTDLNSDASKNAFSTTQVLADQVKTASEAEVDTAGSGSIDFKDSAKVDMAASNAAPTAISLSSSAISEAASSLVVGTLSTVDSDQGSGVAFTYAIAEVAGSDYAAFTINQATGELSLKSQPDYETKTSYSVTILSADDGGKTFSKSFTVAVTDVNDALILIVLAGGSVTEDAAANTITGTLSASDPEGDSPSYSVLGSTSTDGSYSVTGTYGTLVLNASTGAYTYVLNNSATAVNALKASDSKTESFSVQVTDGTNTPAAQSLSFTIQGANDTASIAGVTTGAVTEEDADILTATGTLTISDFDEGEAVFVAQIDTAGSAGLGVFNIETDGAWNYAASNSNSTIQALGAGDAITDTFTAVSADGTTQVVTVTITGANDTASFSFSDALGDTSLSENSNYTSIVPSLIGDTFVGDLTYSLSGIDAALFSVNSSTGVVMMDAKDYETPLDSDANNIYNYTINATDEDGNNAYRNIAVSVQNEVSEIGGITDRDNYENWNYASRTPTITENPPSGFVAYTLSGSDADHFSVNGTTGVVTMIAQNFESVLDSNADNKYDYTLVRTDSANNIATKDITITILNVNEAPTINTTANTSASELSYYNYTFSASDEDINDTVTYSTSTLPSWLSFSASSGVLSGTPGQNDAGIYSISLTATDSAGLTATQSVKLSTTTGSVSVGGSYSGTLDVTGDKDWIAVELTSGQAYGVSLSGNSGSFVDNGIEDPKHDPAILNCGCPSCIGTDKQELEGSNIEATLADPYLYVYDEDGSLIKSDDDSGSGRNSYLTFTPNYSGTYYLEARAWQDNYTGDYKINVSEVVPPRPTGALEWGNAAWDTSQTIDVYFADYGVTVSDGTISIGFSQAEETSMMGMFSNVTNFANIDFQITETQADADIRLAHANLGGGLLGYMYPQNYNSNEGLGVLTSNSSYWNDTSMQVGGFMYGVVVHEIGHGLGLAHPHDTGGGSQVMDGVSYSSDKGDYGQMNQSVYTVMSYNEGFAAHPLGLPSDYGSGYMASFAALDIAVLQSYYGENDSYNAGSNTYSLGSKDYFETIWDGGGTDEIAVTGSADCLIDLRAATLNYEAGGAGFVSYNADALGGFTIANGVVIENAKGGGGSDAIIGNDSDNIIYGGSGSGIKDTLTGNGGADIFISCITDATTDLSFADSITDFKRGTDKIGLDDRAFSDLSLSTENGGTKIVDVNSSKILFWLDGVDYSLIDSEDFITTDFV